LTRWTVPDDVLREALGGAPTIIREQGEQLEASAQSLSPDGLFDGAVRAYERLLERAVAGRTRKSYAVAGGYAKVIRAIRTLQGRTPASDAYYQRLPAFKHELRIAIKGPGPTQALARQVPHRPSGQWCATRLPLAMCPAPVAQSPT
jgi:hypothetical protein